VNELWERKRKFLFILTPLFKKNYIEFLHELFLMYNVFDLVQVRSVIEYLLNKLEINVLYPILFLNHMTIYMTAENTEGCLGSK